MTATLTPTRRPLRQRLMDLARDCFGRKDRIGLRDLDRRALADIGIDASEIESIEAESEGRAIVTRRRVVGSPQPL
jgi:uncharacterized protein YjiS (DUF1127 family)